MSNRRTSIANFWEKTLTAQFGPTELTAQLSATAGLTSPALLVIEPDEPSRREVVLFDGTFTSTQLACSGIGSRYLAGSAAPSGITHPAGSTVRSVPLAQHMDDVNDRVEAHTHTGSADGTALSHANLTNITADDHHAEDHAARHVPGAADATEVIATATWVSVTVSTTSFVETKSVTVAIPSSWVSWTCIVNAGTDVDFSDSSTLVMQATIDGTVKSAGGMAGPNYGHMHYLEVSTGLATTGNRTVKLESKIALSGGPTYLYDGVMVVRAVRTA